ncbi:MAG: hypothetical protein KDA31_07310 [Phycisphaerales bacterium]|nr:hypothetical protein [Phycisphaerales bacterium]
MRIRPLGWVAIAAAGLALITLVLGPADDDTASPPRPHHTHPSRISFSPLDLMAASALVATLITLRHALRTPGGKP